MRGKAAQEQGLLPWQSKVLDNCLVLPLQQGCHRLLVQLHHRLLWCQHICTLSNTTMLGQCPCRSMWLQVQVGALDTCCKYKAQQGYQMMSALCLLLVVVWGAVLRLQLCKGMQNLGICLHLSGESIRHSLC